VTWKSFNYSIKTGFLPSGEIRAEACLMVLKKEIEVTKEINEIEECCNKRIVVFFDFLDSVSFIKKIPLQLPARGFSL
jgi:hypothetical protein